MDQNGPPNYVFGEFTLDLGQCRLCRADREIKLRPKPFEVLKYLVENRGRLVTKDEVLQAIWRDSFVTDDSLVQCMVEVRRALDDAQQRYIRTIARRGYIFHAPVETKIPSETGLKENSLQAATPHITPDRHEAIQPPDLTPSQTAVVGPAGAESLRRRMKWVGAVMLAAIGLPLIFHFAGRRDSGVEGKSIAVLPFRNLSQDKANEYFSDGITDDIITQLSRIGSLKVVSRTSVMAYKSSNKNLRQIASELGVETILEGTVRREGNQVRISSQLIDASTDTHLWAEVYDRPVGDIFQIQSEVAQRVAGSLRARFSPNEQQRLGQKQTVSITAYDCYLNGRASYYSATRIDNDDAIAMFKKALEADPNYALAYAGLSDSYSQRVYLLGHQRDWIQTAEGLAEKAISIDPRLAEGYKALGYSQMQKGKYRRALDWFHKAVEINPNFEPAVSNIGYVNLVLGKFDEALPWMKKSLDLEPVSGTYQPSKIALAYLFLADDARANEWFKEALAKERDLDQVRLRVSWWHLTQGNVSEALDQSRKILPFSADYNAGLHVAATAEILLHDNAQALRDYDRLLAVDPEGRGWVPPTRYLTGLASALWRTGQQGRARALLEQSRKLDEEDLKQGDETYNLRYDLAAVESILGHTGEACSWLEKAVDTGFRNYRFALIDPTLENLKEDARFRSLMDRVKKQVEEMRRRVESP
ncbi:MAG TPA: tetratricopeptide repeat protein [Acidobacteriota bacterium]|jgi:TolB-like protein/DNA-binding winged helix-turn-helix (wHTH) protein/Flp pilus assembly protein TadD